MDRSHRALRIAVVSHAAMVEVNQEPFDALAAAGADVTVIVPRALRTDIRGRIGVRALPSLRARLVALPVVLGGYSRWLGGQRGIHAIVYAGLARALRAARPHVVFVEEEPYSFAALQAAVAARRLGVPFVVHQNQNIARRLPPPFSAISRAVLPRAAAMTVRSRAAEELVRAGGFTGPVVPFPHGVDPSRFVHQSAPPHDLPHPVVGFIGRLVAEKGIELLARALRSLEASLLVIGDGPARAGLEASLRGSPHLLLGALPHDEVPPWYAAMDVVAVPSLTAATWKEQFGRIVIEANAAGVPVVTSDSGELPVTVQATGGGIVVPEGDAEALATGLKTLLEDRERARALGEAGRRAVTERFTPEAIARDLLALLREVAR